MTSVNSTTLLSTNCKLRLARSSYVTPATFVLRPHCRAGTNHGLSVVPENDRLDRGSGSASSAPATYKKAGMSRANRDRAMSSQCIRRSYEEVEKLLAAPGSMVEMEKRLIAGQVHRVYKHLWPTVRAFFLSIPQTNADKINLVFEEERLTYQEVTQRAVQTAIVLSERYDICKGDRVALCFHNCPEYVIVFWALHLIGAVPVLVNAWLSQDTLLHSLLLTQCKAIFFDPERADRMKTLVSKLTNSALIVIRSQGGDWPGMSLWTSILEISPTRGDTVADPGVTPEDNALILFTSGTTGLPKGVLLTQRQFMTGLGNYVADGIRDILRRGESIPVPTYEEGPQSAVLLPTPLFHITGISIVMFAAMYGVKLVLMRKWDVNKAVKIIKSENIKMAGGVPSTVFDLMEKSKELESLDYIFFAGAPTSESMLEQAKKAFPRSTLSQVYGQTECTGGIIGFSGKDYYERPGSCGRPLPINDILIMNDSGVECKPNQPGEIWIRGPNVMKAYWGDPEATAKTITQDGWLKTGDIGYIDSEGYVYIKDRIKDIIIRGGENVDSVMVQNAFYHDERVYEAAAVGVPDERLGELVVVWVTLKPKYRGMVQEVGKVEAELMEVARKHLPQFAVPVMILLYDGDFPRGPSEKIIKMPLRKIAAEEWKKREIRRIKHKL